MGTVIRIPEDKVYSWSDYESAWAKLFWMIKDYLDSEDNDFDLKKIVVVGRGGMTLGQCLSNTLEVDCVVVMAESYDDDKRQKGISFARHCSYTGGPPEGDILIVDDLTDTGRTLSETKRYVRKKFPAIRRIKTVGWEQKSDSTESLDFFAKRVSPDASGRFRWTEFPWETVPSRPSGLVSQEGHEGWLPEDQQDA